MSGTNGVVPPLPPKRGGSFSVDTPETSVTLYPTGTTYATSTKVKSSEHEGEWGKEKPKNHKAMSQHKGSEPPPPPPPRNSIDNSGRSFDSGLPQSLDSHGLLVPYAPPAPPRVTVKKKEQMNDDKLDGSDELAVYGNAESDEHRYYAVSDSNVELETTGYHSELRRGEPLHEDLSYEPMNTGDDRHGFTSLSYPSVPPRTDKARRFEASGISSSQEGPVPKSKRNAKVILKRNISQVAGQIDPISDTELTSIMRRRNLCNNFQSDPTHTLYINRVIKHLAKHDAELIPGSDSVEKLVRLYIQDILRHINDTQPRFEGTLQPCGSFYEGVKINSPNEFDYVLELNTLHQSQLEPEFVMPETFKPRKDEKIRPQSYFKLRFNNRVPEVWKCHECHGCQTSQNCSSVQLDSRVVQEMFRKTVSDSVKAVSRPGGTGEPKVTCSGPAVTIYTKLTKEAIEEYLMAEQNKKTMKALTKLEHEHIIVIKIDITLALPWKTTQAGKWPLEGTCDAKLNKPVPQCNLVASGDFWKVSFSHLETVLVRDETGSDQGKRNCFLVLKHLRDDLAITDPDEAGVLGTYPIKVTFLKECQTRRLPEDWNFWHQGERAISILEEVESRGKDGTLTSFHIQNDPILMESDKCYMESRRIKQHLYEINKTFNLHGKVHTGLLTFYWLISFGILLASVEYYRDFRKYRRPKDACPKPDSDIMRRQTVELGNFLFGYVPLAIGQIVNSIAGIIFWLVYKFTRKQNMLYTIYCSVKFVHMVLLGMAVIHFAFGIRFAVIYQQIIVCKDNYNPEPEMQALLISVMFMACLIILTFVLHIVAVFAMVKCDCQVYCWEWVFYDRIFLEKCCCCRSRRRRKREGISHSNPVYQPN